MKLKKLFGGLFLSFALIAGVGAGLLVKENRENAPVEKTEASTLSAGSILYFRFYSGFFDASATAWANYPDSSGNWHSEKLTTTITTKGSETLYKLTLSYSATTMQILRKNSSGSEQWGYSGSQACGSINLYEITGYGSGQYLNGGFCTASIVEYYFKTPSNGSVTLTAYDSSSTNKGTIAKNALTYLYSDWHVTYSASPNSGYIFSTWTYSSSPSGTYSNWTSGGGDSSVTVYTTSNTYHSAKFASYTESYVYMEAYDNWTAYAAYTWETIDGNVRYLSGTYGNIKKAGAAISNIKLDGVSVAKVPYFYNTQANCGGLLYQGNDGNKSGDIAHISDHGYYSFVNDAITLNEAKGQALEVMTLIVNSCGNATVDGKVVTNSICGISKANRTTILSNYNSLSNSAKSYFNQANTTFYTYTPGSTSAKSNVTFARIIQQLQAQATAQANQAAFVAFLFGGDEAAAQAFPVVLVVAIVSVTAVGGYFFLRKRRNEK